MVLNPVQRMQWLLLVSADPKHTRGVAFSFESPVPVHEKETILDAGS
jgi:hypothetical protein